MKKIHEMISKIENALYAQLLGNVENIDTDEFGKVADIYKDLMDANKNCAKAKYYESVIEAMEESGAEERRSYRETMPEYMIDYDMAEDDYNHMRDTSKQKDRMYYPERRMPYTDDGMMERQQDRREGRSGRSRRGYMESKEIHPGNTEADKMINRKELDKWVDDIGTDVKELIPSMSAEERTVLKTKLTNLVNTI